MIFYYLLYLAISGIILIFISNKSWKEWLLKMTIVSFLPGVGWLFPVFLSKAWITNRGALFSEYMKQQEENIDVELLKTFTKVNKEKELNIIPIEDALLVNDYMTRRRVMIDVLKEDTMQYIEVIKSAVLNEDTETSHYAVSAIMEAKRKLSISLQEISVKFDQHKENNQVAKTYAEVLKKYIKSGFLDNQTLRRYKYTYIQTLHQIIINGAEDMEVFEEKFKTEMEMKEYIQAEQTCQQYLSKYPDEENAYLNLMDLYYTTRSITNMLKVLEDLKKSSIRLSNQALSIVRYWSGGLGYESTKKLF
ncbi:hypothetical protein [Psychrobacillus antarcticus]|uniref:hypothetical protein n=1 Tax=Psychrobacillus antarcticus TaxID=2879115 RepID=UPI00240785B3|nr:hypothetical protein [Psychrobacillus antarcticus]